jgi:hypothetical protein
VFVCLVSLCCLVVQDFVNTPEAVQRLETRVRTSLVKNAKHASQFNAVSVVSFWVATQFFFLSLFVKSPSVACLAWDKVMLFRGKHAPWETTFNFSAYTNHCPELLDEEGGKLQPGVDDTYVTIYVEKLNDVFAYGSPIVYSRTVSVPLLRRTAQTKVKPDHLLSKLNGDFKGRGDPLPDYYVRYDAKMDEVVARDAAYKVRCMKYTSFDIECFYIVSYVISIDLCISTYHSISSVSI